MIAGDTFKIPYEASDTIGTLKQKISTEKWLSLSSLTLYCGPCLLTDDTLMVADLFEFTDSFLLELPEAGEIEIDSDKEVLLLTGPSKKFDAPLRINKTIERPVKIKAHNDKFGIVTHANVHPSGTRSYQVERYQVKGKGKVILKTSESREVLVYIKGEKDPLIPRVMTYVEKVGFRNHHCANIKIIQRRVPDRRRRYMTLRLFFPVGETRAGTWMTRIS